MRAVVSDRYGPPELMRIDDLPVPTPGAGQVLVRLAATSVNLSDWECQVGAPLWVRAVGGFRRPNRSVLGSDIAGWIEACGEGVTGFEPGDEVYGDNLDLKGGFAEFTVAPESALAHKPPELSFAEAAAIPQSAAIAVAGTADLGPGDRVLVNGGGGGSGSFAVPMAKQAGAHVTGVDNDGKLDFMRALGADEVIDHRRTDFTRGETAYDLVLDLVASRPPWAHHRVVAPGGRYWCVGGSVPALLGALTIGTVMGRATGRRLGVLLVPEGPAAFEPVAGRCVAGELDVHVDRTYPLDDAPAALAHVGEGRARGKVVVEVQA